MPATTVRADQSEGAWCNWLLVTQHCVAFIKGCCIMWLRRAGSPLLMRGAIRNPTADSKHLRLVKKCISVSLYTASGSLGPSARRDKKRLLLGENKEPNVSYRWEKPVISAGGSSDMKGRWREMQRRKQMGCFRWKMQRPMKSSHTNPYTIQQNAARWARVFKNNGYRQGSVIFSISNNNATRKLAKLAKPADEVRGQLDHARDEMLWKSVCSGHGQSMESSVY